MNEKNKMKKVIVADDTEHMRSSIVYLIEVNFPDVHIDEVDNGRDLVERVLHENYALVISDNDMEGYNNGLEALRKIRESGSDVPIYIMSGKNVGEAALSNGATKFYNKHKLDTFEEDLAKYLTD